MRKLSAALGHTVALALLLQVERASAESEPVDIVYDAPAGCNTRAEFVANVLGRTSRARLAQPNERARRFEVRLSESRGKGKGELRTVEPDGAVSSRELEGDTCQEVADALALVTALAIDPNANLAKPAPEPSPPPKTEPAPPKPAPAKTPKPTKTAGPVKRAPPREPPASPIFAAGAALFADSTIAPAWTPGAMLFGSVSMAPLDARLSVARTLRRTIETDAGTAKLDLTSLSLELCADLAVSDAFVVCPGLGGEAGLVHASGSDTESPRSASRNWVSAKAFVRPEWRPSRTWFLEFEAALVAPLLRDRFRFDTPPTTAHEPPRLGARAAIGVGYRFQ